MGQCTIWPLWENTASSTKQEVHNVSQCCQSRTELTSTKVDEVWRRGFCVMWIDRHTDRHIHRNNLHLSYGWSEYLIYSVTSSQWRHDQISEKVDMVIMVWILLAKCLYVMLTNHSLLHPSACRRSTIQSYLLLWLSKPFTVHSTQYCKQTYCVNYSLSFAEKTYHADMDLDLDWWAIVASRPTTLTNLCCFIQCLFRIKVCCANRTSGVWALHH